MSGRIFFNMQGSVAKQRGLVKMDFTSGGRFLRLTGPGKAG
jgi:hypothetical protein